jgi:hypothetical protein
VTKRAEQRRKQRRRQHLDTTRQSDGASIDSEATSIDPDVEARHATVRIAVAVACLLGAQFLHWSVIDQHAQEWAASGVFFFVLAMVEGIMTVLVIARLRPWVAATGIVVSVIPVMVWAVDRSFGLPFGPTKGIRGTIGRSDVLSVIFEILTVVALWPFLRPRYGVTRASNLDIVSKAVIGTTVVYVVGFSYWALIGDQGTIHHGLTTTTTAVGGQASPTPTILRPLNTGPPLAPTQTLNYTGTEYSFSGPDTVTAGVTGINLKNIGVEAHDMQVARIPDSSPTPSDQAKLETMFAEAQIGSESAPTIIADTHSTDPGQTSSATVDLTAGRYILSCGNTAADGTAHFAKGMIMVLTVTDPVDTARTTTVPTGTAVPAG